MDSGLSLREPRNDDSEYCSTATKQHDGQISSDYKKSCQAKKFRKSKIFLLSFGPNQCASIAIPSHSEGVGHRHDEGRVAVDVTVAMDGRG